MMYAGRGESQGNASCVIGGGLRLERETVYFALASALDFLMTWSLLGFHGSAGDVWFVESNPVAGFFLSNWGVMGLIGFKLVMVGMIAGVCQVIASRRVGTARRVLQFAAITASLVVVYSAGLMIRHSS
jgi:hypothetical protein